MNSDTAPLRVLSVMAHQDDFEFNLGGTFALLRRKLGDGVRLGIVATTNGASGHHVMSAAETAVRREAEALSSAAIIGAQYQRLSTLEGDAVADGQFLVSRSTLGGLWNTIRRFKADVVFCPPVASDPLAGVHIDHEQTAIAMRYVGFQLSVPRAYPTWGNIIDYEYRSPLIINVDDFYHGTTQADIRQDISSVMETKLSMALCHRSQVLEWLPFVSREDPITEAMYEQRFQDRHLAINQRYGASDDVASEYFRITRWGRAPRQGELETLFPQWV
jgi:LmbE family N-acetylglucosaminyl deacetylase